MLWTEHCSSIILPPLSSIQKLEYLTCSSSTLALLSEQDIPKKLCVKIEESVTCFPLETLAKCCKLRSLTIKDAKEISVTTEGLQALKELTSLYLHNCQTMTCLPEGMLRHLTALQHLHICQFPEVVELPEDFNHLDNLDRLWLKGLYKMTLLPQASVFHHLKSLNLRDLLVLESLPDQLPSLNILTVINCPKVVSIPALPNLKELTVIGCPQLERRCQRGSGEDWHEIAHVRRIFVSPI